MYTISHRSKTGGTYSKLGSAISSLDEVPSRHRIMVLYRMKVKNVVLLLLLFLTFVTLWVVFNPNIMASTFVTETHNHISNNLQKIKNMNVKIHVQAPPKIWNVDDRYLERLGFNENSTLHPVRSQLTAGLKLPMVVTTATDGDFDSVRLLVRSMQKHMKNRKLMVFDLGMGARELEKLVVFCNITERCDITKFDYDEFPSHVHNLDTGAYKPLAIQLALDRYGAILWTELKQQFITGNLTNVTRRAERVGLSAWTGNEPTSALTHPGMYKFFNTKADQYYFQHMVKTEHLMIYNTRTVHDRLMRPWVQCALTNECIWPTGAQRAGCTMRRKPPYSYSGCHRFAESALNIILGQMFKENRQPFVSTDELFGHEIIPEATTVAPNITGFPLFSDLFVRNSTRIGEKYNIKQNLAIDASKSLRRVVSKVSSKKRKNLKKMNSDTVANVAQQ